MPSNPQNTDMDTVSPTCEILVEWPPHKPVAYCGKPTARWYPAMGGGTMALCAEHGQPHAGYSHEYDAARGSLVETTNHE